MSELREEVRDRYAAGEGEIFGANVKARKPGDVMAAPTVLFVCVHNAGRSQTAAAPLELTPRGGSPSVPREARRRTRSTRCRCSMRELGIDLSRSTPKPIDTDAVRQADVVVTMGCGELPRVPRHALSRLGPSRPGRPVRR